MFSMNTLRKQTGLVTACVCLLMLLSCALPNRVVVVTATPDTVNGLGMTQTAIQSTLNAVDEGSSDGVQQPTQQPVQLPSETLQPSLTPTLTLSPTITLTLTPMTPKVSVSVDTNCRKGPGTLYDYIGALLVGETGTVLGKSSDGLYWIIQNPDAPGTCWLWGNYASIVGDTTMLPVYTPPPTPTPSFLWGGGWTVWAGPMGGPFTSGTMTVTINGTSISATLSIGGGTVTFTGSTSTDYKSVGGSWVAGTNTGSFEWFAKGTSQFTGNYSQGSTTFEMCGARSGGRPDPCFSP